MARRGVHVTDRDLGMRRMMREVKRVHGLRLTVGYHNDKGEIAKIATVHEYGSPPEGKPPKPGRPMIPPRPTLGPTAEKGGRRYRERLRERLGAAAGGQGTVEGALHLTGADIVADVQRAILDLHEPKLAASTIARKGSSKPLIDTGAMRGALAHRVVKRGA